jgi:hypothetical protein
MLESKIMKKFQLVGGALLLLLTGCSSIGGGWNNTIDLYLAQMMARFARKVSEEAGPVIATGNLVYLRNAFSDCFLQKVQA